jgi:hypothetical protein
MSGVPGASPPPTVPAFSPQALMQCYLRGRHDDLSEGFLAILRHFRETTYHKLERQGQHFVNEFVKHFLHLFTQSDYVPRRDHQIEFVRLNLTISNLVALSSFKTTEPYLELLGGQPGNLAKLLALYSARNRASYNRASFFDADPALASAWYAAYAEIYRTGLIREDVYENLRKHFEFRDDRLSGESLPLDSYFSSTYVPGDCDRAIKPVLNEAARQLAQARYPRIRNRPDPRKIAVLSGNWQPEHSVYRINDAYLKSLEGYHLTFFQLGKKPGADLSLFHDVKQIAAGPDGTIDLGSLVDNDFMIAYYPDVGLTPLSIVLANLRLAPIQIASLGHSVSTWGADIDYVFSGLDVEVAENPERNYSERLVLLPGSGAIHNRPNYTLTGRRKDKDDAAFLINCPWNAQKVNHRFVRTLRELIRRARKPIRLRLFVSASLNLRNDYLPFVRELDSVLGAGVAEVCLGVSYGEYMSKMEEGDICLDSYHFGGCNTVADGLYLRKLTVTREGDKWYNRIGPRMVRMAGLPELATSTEEEYLDVILRLIHDDEYRAGLQTRLDRADLEGTIFDRSDARYFAKAIAYLIEHHSRLRLGADRSPIRIER